MPGVRQGWPAFRRFNTALVACALLATRTGAAEVPPASLIDPIFEDFALDAHIPGGSHVLLLPDAGVGLFAFANRTYAGPSVAP